MKNLPDRVLSHPGSEVPSRVEASSQGREIRLHEPRFLEAATERADSTVKPLRVALVEPVAYLCDSYVRNSTRLEPSLLELVVPTVLTCTARMRERQAKPNSVCTR